MNVEKIIEELLNTEKKSDSPTEFEIALSHAFDFLGFKAKLIGGKGDTDVLLTSNIGKQSYKVDVDGKTSKNGKIPDSQIDWHSLQDHKKKNNSDFVLVVGKEFAGGNLEKRALEYNVCLLATNELVSILEAHSKYPFTLLELKDLFSKSGRLTEQVDDLLSQNGTRRSFIEKFKIIIEEIEKIQSTSLGYFTFESIVGREKIQELEIEPEEIGDIISLLMIPFINAIYEIEDGKYVLTLTKKDLSNTFKQISMQMKEDDLTKSLMLGNEEFSIHFEEPINERKFGTKYFKWEKRGNSIFATARVEKPYEHSCPIEHFKSIIEAVKDAFNEKNIINNDIVAGVLDGKELSHNRFFKGKPEEYKIRMALGILELEGFIKWTGSLRPIEYTLEKPIEELEKWEAKHL